MGKYEQKRRSRFAGFRDPRLIAAVAVGAVILLVLTLTLCYFALRKDREEVFGDVNVAGVNLSGLTLPQAKAALRQATDDTYTRKDMVVHAGDVSVRIPAAASHARLDVDGAAEAAFRFHRQHPGEPFDLTPYLNLNGEAILNAVSELSRLLNKNAGVSYEVQSNPTEPNSLPTLILTVGAPRRELDADALRREILSAYSANRFSVTAAVSQGSAEFPDLSEIYQKTYVAPVNAAVDPDTGKVLPEQYGRCFDLSQAQTLLGNAKTGDVLRIPFLPIAPDVAASDLPGENQTSFTDVLASYRTPHTGDADRNTNLRLACQAINGLVIAPGETFSYNQALGPRTADRGYKPAESYVNGLTVDTLGGGICQVSSTLYYCTMVADLETVERYAHSYVPEYMPKGTDAAVSWGSKDFRFRNSTHAPIRIEAWMENGYVNVRLMGTEEKSYTVKIDYEQLSSTKATTVYRELPPDNSEGYKDGQVIVTPYDGSTVKTYKYFYDRHTGELLSVNYVDTSRYRVRNEVICKIVVPEPTAPTTPEPTEPEPTAPTTPEPTEPEPTAPTTPEPTEPEPTAPTTPEPTEPEPTAPTTPEPTEPEPTAPTAPENSV